MTNKRISWTKLFNIYMIVLITLSVAAITCAFFFLDASDILINAVSLFATLSGIIAVVVEYNRNKTIALAGRLITIYEDFNDISTNHEIQYKLECLKRRNINLFKKDDLALIRKYLSFFEGIAPLLNKGMMQFKQINSILGYRFFLIMNSPYVQELELIPNCTSYRGAILMHYLWTNWMHTHGFKRSGSATSLEKNFAGYYELLGLEVKKEENRTEN